MTIPDPTTPTYSTDPTTETVEAPVTVVPPTEPELTPEQEAHDENIPDNPPELPVPDVPETLPTPASVSDVPTSDGPAPVEEVATPTGETEETGPGTSPEPASDVSTTVGEPSSPTVAPSLDTSEPAETAPVPEPPAAAVFVPPESDHTITSSHEMVVSGDTDAAPSVMTPTAPDVNLIAEIHQMVSEIHAWVKLAEQNGPEFIQDFKAKIEKTPLGFLFR